MQKKKCHHTKNKKKTKKFDHMSTTQTTMKKTFGTRKEVFNGLALKTTGGLTKKDLFFKNGRIKSIKASKRATERMNSNEVLKALFESKQFKKK